MLVLTRKNGEIVHLGHKIEVKVLAIRGNTVKLGFSAPPKIAIRRDELPTMTQRHKFYERKATPSLAVG